MNTYYEQFENENLLMLFVNEEFGKDEWWSVRNTDTNQVISYVKLDTTSNEMSIEFTKHMSDDDLNIQNFQELIEDFQLNLEFRTYTEI